MTAHSKARYVLDCSAFDEEDLVPSVRPSEGAATVAWRDYMWGGHPPAVTEIPYDWLTAPARWRPDQPRNVATVTRAGGSSARAQDAASVDAVQERPFTATVDSQVVDDPRNYATWIVAYYTDVRQRMPTLTLNLVSRTDVECWRILGRSIGDRIRITGTPVGANAWPDGTTELVIEGVEHRIGGDTRYVVWNTAPVIGAAPGEAGPWFRLGESFTDGTDVVPF
jgi:hypothetical protein